MATIWTCENDNDFTTFYILTFRFPRSPIIYFDKLIPCARARRNRAKLKRKLVSASTSLELIHFQSIYIYRLIFLIRKRTFAHKHIVLYVTLFVWGMIWILVDGHLLLFGWKQPRALLLARIHREINGKGCCIAVASYRKWVHAQSDGGGDQMSACIFIHNLATNLQSAT